MVGFGWDGLGCECALAIMHPSLHYAQESGGGSRDVVECISSLGYEAKLVKKGMDLEVLQSESPPPP